MSEEDTDAVHRWSTDTNLSSKKVKKAQNEGPVVGYFLRLKEEGFKPKWNKVSSQGNELKLLWE